MSVVEQHIIQLLGFTIVISCASWQYHSLKRIRVANARILSDYALTTTFTDPLVQLSPYTNLTNQSQLQNANLANLYAGLSNASAQNWQGSMVVHGVMNPGYLHDTPGTPLDLPKSEATEGIVAWRAWVIRDVGSRVILLSINTQTLWPWGEPATADFFTTAVLDTHGIHAFKTEPQAKSYAAHTVWGEVSLWGRVIEHDLGYRAEFAYPRTIVVPAGMPNAAAIAKKLARAYGIEARVEG